MHWTYAHHARCGPLWPAVVHLRVMHTVPTVQVTIGCILSGPSVCSLNACVWQLQCWVLFDCFHATCALSFSFYCAAHTPFGVGVDFEVHTRVLKANAVLSVLFYVLRAGGECGIVCIAISCLYLTAMQWTSLCKQSRRTQGGGIRQCVGALPAFFGPYAGSC